MNNTNPGVQFITIDAEQDGQRIDNFLKTQLKGVPKSLIYRILRKGEVRVNKKRIKPEYKLCVGDEIRVPPVRVAEENELPSSKLGSVQALAHQIIYEDDAIIVLNKPSGLAVHGGSGLSFGLIEMLRAMRPDTEHLELIHRIDRDTSGCVMIAKSVTMLRGMHELFRTNKITKVYHALVKGYAAEKFIVDEPLKKFVLASGERLVRVHPEGQPSRTIFSVLSRYNGATLLQAAPVTGRTHQIRVHAAQRGLPIVGDQKYGNKDYNQTSKQLGLKRLFLHARELKFICPINNTLIKVQAEYDQDWNNGLQILAKGHK